jgi:hypothetical protein
MGCFDEFLDASMLTLRTAREAGNESEYEALRDNVDANVRVAVEMPLLQLL